MHCICLSVIFVNSVLKRGEIYFLLVFLEEFKYIVKEKKIRKYINDDIEISSDGSDEEIFDEE